MKKSPKNRGFLLFSAYYYGIFTVSGLKLIVISLSFCHEEQRCHKSRQQLGQDNRKPHTVKLKQLGQGKYSGYLKDQGTQEGDYRRHTAVVKRGKEG